MFRKAQRSQVYIKLAITGPTGSGKTFSALRLATGLLKGSGKRIAYIDTENDSASLYSDSFDFDSCPIEPPFDHQKFVEAINFATNNGYGAIVIDSASHFWEGILEYKGKLDSRPGSNSYTNWNEAGKKFSGILTAVLQSKIHLIACMRSKMDYIMEDNGKGKQVPKKVGLAPIMRDGIDYEFTTVFDIAMNHECQTSKDRSGLFKDSIFQITEGTGEQIATWLNSATPKAETPTPTTVPTVNTETWDVKGPCLIEERPVSETDKRLVYVVTCGEGKIAATMDADTAKQLRVSVDFIVYVVKQASGKYRIEKVIENDDIP